MNEIRPIDANAIYCKLDYWVCPDPDDRTDIDRTVIRCLKKIEQAPTIDIVNWVPTTERNPPEITVDIGNFSYKEYLVTLQTGEVTVYQWQTVKIRNKRVHRWGAASRVYGVSQSVIAWAELPAGYKMEQEIGVSK